VKNRRSLTPSDAPADSGDVHATRRGGARHEISARITLRPAAACASASTAVPGSGATAPRAAALSAGSAGSDAVELEGWALNVSRGGIRVILEGSVELGAEFEVTVTGSSVGEDQGGPRMGRVVWVQEEPDGVVAGIEFRASFI
jgi:hypothetical protein